MPGGNCSRGGGASGNNSTGSGAIYIRLAYLFSFFPFFLLMNRINTQRTRGRDVHKIRPRRVVFFFYKRINNRRNTQSQKERKRRRNCVRRDRSLLLGLISFNTRPRQRQSGENDSIFKHPRARNLRRQKKKKGEVTLR